MKALTKHERAKMLTKMYDKDCEVLRLESVLEHGLLARYYLRPRVGERTFLWAEVVVLRGGSLLVHGDVDTVVFSNCYGMARARDVVHWMARSEYDYATEKAAIGGSIDRCFDPEVALATLLEFRRRGMIGKDAAGELAQMLQDGTDEHEFASQVYGLTSDSELCTMGRVTHPRVFMACAVLRRLKRLLSEMDDEQMRNKAAYWLRRPGDGVLTLGAEY